MDDVIAKTKDLQIIELATKTHEVALPGIAEKVKVSDSVKVVGSGITTKGSEFLVKTGSELTNDFSINANAHAKYVGISVETGGGYSLASTIKKARSLG
ncbi:hypothetical protein N7461_007956 [Penicillium sp. DV-2018c]|nr:hypothetical protein N7461_007956 [Penicillium sp. DV-2018c]